ncbi:MAG: hypothetical protein HPM95_08845 [Alphaproteobacteria bacterium]|nr:hypothetical protein [Alphaproteobacteria bacterium]
MENSAMQGAQLRSVNSVTAAATASELPLSIASSATSWLVGSWAGL